MRVIPVVWFLLGLLAMVLLERWLPLFSVQVPLLRPLGYALAGGGFLLVIAAALTFRRARTPVRPFAEAEVLVRSGPFRLSRNPIYLGMLLVLAGIALRLGALSPLLVLPAFVVIINQRIIRAEEDMLRRKFGNAYADYAGSVRRWL